MKSVTITVGPYTVSTSPRVAEKIVRDPAKLLEVYEFGKESAEIMRRFGYGKEEGPQT